MLVVHLCQTSAYLIIYEGKKFSVSERPCMSSTYACGCLSKISYASSQHRSQNRRNVLIFLKSKFIKYVSNDNSRVTQQYPSGVNVSCIADEFQIGFDVFVLFSGDTGDRG